MYPLLKVVKPMNQLLKALQFKMEMETMKIPMETVPFTDTAEVYTAKAGPLISDCIVIDNNAYGGGGGGVFCYNASPLFYNTIIRDNITDDVEVVSMLEMIKSSLMVAKFRIIFLSMEEAVISDVF